MNKEVEEIEVGDRMIICPDPIHHSLQLRIWDDGREVVLLGYQTDTSHEWIEGIAADLKSHGFEMIPSAPISITKAGDWWAEETDAHNALLFNLVDDQFEDITKAFNKKSQCFCLVNDKEFEKRQQDPRYTFAGYDS